MRNLRNYAVGGALAGLLAVETGCGSAALRVAGFALQTGVAIARAVNEENDKRPPTNSRFIYNYVCHDGMEIKCKRKHLIERDENISVIIRRRPEETVIVEDIIPLSRGQIYTPSYNIDNLPLGGYRISWIHSNGMPMEGLTFVKMRKEDARNFNNFVMKNWGKSVFPEK